ncbi:MAG: GH36-type glycosyl hydrolase domain-containing protein [Fusobacteriota bacterium]
MKKIKKWEYIDKKGTFKLENPELSSYLYFPLTNEAGMMSAITPDLHGDIKADNNTFLLEPTSVEDLHNSNSSRNFWVSIEGEEIWSATGNSAKQKTYKFGNQDTEKVVMRAGFLWHQVVRKNSKIGIKSEVTNFVPANDDKVELMRVTLSNISDEDLKITPTAAIPIYGRSADNIRDHRHVTALLHRTNIKEYGVEVKPTLSFDERGHQVNEIKYGVFGADESGKKPESYFPVMEEFIGEGGSLDWPKAIVNGKKGDYLPDDKIDGYETVGGLQFEKITLKPGEEKSYIIAMGIDEDNTFEKIEEKYLSSDKFEMKLGSNIEYWDSKLSSAEFVTGDSDFDNWMRWVTLQPILRRIYGCSFLPHHDYGKGGRGWRDLWQDCLALLLMEPEGVKETLYNNFGGVRIDGTNATIIGNKPGEFIADRNNISRIWMDHGAWPFLTTKLYLDQSGDLEFLSEKQTYFKDAHIMYGQKLDKNWTIKDGNKQKSSNGEIYEGTMLEHMLIQHLVSFYNVGEHNNMRLEGADWNDGLDMADENGESVAFTAIYGSNLLEMANLLEVLKDKNNTSKIEIMEELLIMIDTKMGSDSKKTNYDVVSDKREVLNRYLKSTQGISGKKVKISIDDLIKDLRKKGNWVINHIRKNEWIKNKDGQEWFNGYYDDDGERLEGDNPLGVRMTLTGQVFNIMGDVATDSQVEKIIDSANRYLKDETVGGYRLNTNFKEVLSNMGRVFGFAFGHKENGAMFSHMAVMYGNALYKRGFSEAGFEVLDSIYQHTNDFEKSRIYPGIPEYINEKGRGLYHYLTGSASWLLITVINQMFGVRGKLGDLVLDPKLLNKQFDEDGKAKIKTIFADKNIQVIYNNSKNLEVSEYKITDVKINGKKVNFEIKDGITKIKRKSIEDLSDGEMNKIEVTLD